MNGCFYYAGQVCTSAERLLVHEEVHDEFVEKLKERASELRIGDPALEETRDGPDAERQDAERVTEHVEDARGLGAEIEQFGLDEGSSTRRPC